MFFAPSKSRQRARIRNMGVPKTSDHIQITIRMPNPSQKPPASSKAPYQDLKDMDVLRILKSRQKVNIQNCGVSMTSDIFQIMIKMPNPSQEPPASSKAPYQDLKDIYVLCTFKIKLDSPNLEHEYSIDQLPYPNKDQDAKPLRNLQHPPKPQMRT